MICWALLSFSTTQAAKYHYPTNDGYISGDNRSHVLVLRL